METHPEQQRHHTTLKKEDNRLLSYSPLTGVGDGSLAKEKARRKATPLKRGYISRLKQKTCSANYRE